MILKKILIIDDAEDHANIIKMNLESTGLYKCDTAYAGGEGIKKTEASHFDIIISDLVMPGLDGVDTLKSIKNLSPDSALIFMSAKFDRTYWEKAAFMSEEGQKYEVDKIELRKKFGKVHYIAKPFSKEEILELIDKVLDEMSGLP